MMFFNVLKHSAVHFRHIFKYKREHPQKQKKISHATDFML